MPIHITCTVTLYTFDELSDCAKERSSDACIDENIRANPWTFTEEGEKHG